MMSVRSNSPISPISRKSTKLAQPNRHPIPLNILDRVPPERTHILVSHVLSIFRKLYPEHWQHRQEHIMRNALLALLERNEPCTLLDVYWLLADWRYRKKVAAEVKDPVVRAFWTSEFSKYVYQYKGEALAPIQNKLGAFLTSLLWSGTSWDRGRIRLISGRLWMKEEFYW